MFAFVPTSPITNKKRNEISDQYLNHVNNIIFGLKKVWKRSDYLLIESKIKLLFGIMPSIRNRVLCSGMLLYLHLISDKIFFHPAKFDNFKDQTISDYKTVSVP